MSKKVATAIAPIQGAVDPFNRIIALLSSRLDYLSKIFAATCPDRLAHRLEAKDFHSRVYVLQDAPGAGDAAKKYLTYLKENPPPDTFLAFNEAVRESRELTAAAQIPFSDSDPLFNDCRERHERLMSMTVFSPSKVLAGIPGARLTGPVTLQSVWLDELMDCQPLYERLRAFAAQARGAGLLRSQSTESGKVASLEPISRTTKNKKAEARDEWLYRKAKKGDTTFRQIMLELKKKASMKKWRSLGSPQAVEQAVDRYIKRHQLPPLPPRRPL